MTFIRAHQLLLEVAQQSQKQKEAFSRLEIAQKINEIKYLSAQRKVPRLSLRKEIIHLEHKLQGVYELEKKLFAQNRHESAKVAALKHHIVMLKKKLAAAQDKKLQKKVEKLSQLLGDYLAQKSSTEDVKLAFAELTSKKGKEPQRPAFLSSPAPDFTSRIHLLHVKLDALKQELEIKQKLGKGAQVKTLEASITLLEQKLQGYSQKKAEVEVENAEIKHTLLFDTSPSAFAVATPAPELDLELEKELPLPPPPKMKKGKEEAI